MPDYLFVYGTLRAESTHPMAHRLRAGAKHVGKGSAPGLLYDLGDYPAALFVPDEKYRVIGDVFVLAAPRLLADLDKYEGYSGEDDDDAMFQRIAIDITLETGETVRAWAYGLKNPTRARLIGSGDFIADRSLRKPRALRP